MAQRKNVKFEYTEHNICGYKSFIFDLGYVYLKITNTIFMTQKIAKAILRKYLPRFCYCTPRCPQSQNSTKMLMMLNMFNMCFCFFCYQCRVYLGSFSTTSKNWLPCMSLRHPYRSNFLFIFSFLPFNIVS